VDDVLFAFFVNSVDDCLELMSAWVHKVRHCTILTTDGTLEQQCRGHCTYDASNDYRFKEGVRNLRRGDTTKWDVSKFNAKRLFETMMPKVASYMHTHDLDWLVRSDADTWWNRTELVQTIGGAKPAVALGRLYRHTPCCGEWADGNPTQSKSYLTGGAGIILNIAVVVQLTNSMRECSQPTRGVGIGSGEDLWFGKCLYTLGIPMQNVTTMHQRMQDTFHDGDVTLSIHPAAAYENAFEKGIRPQRYYENLSDSIRRSRLVTIIERNQDRASSALRYTIKPGDHGIGSQMHLMVSCLSHALHTNNAFEIVGDWIFAGGKPFSHWFEPIKHNATHISKCPPYSGSIEPLPSFRDMGERLWYTGVLLTWAMRPNERLKGAISATRLRQLLRTPSNSNARLPTNYVGMQIRHSTTWIYGRENVPLSKFMAKLELFQIPRQTIFISTEDQAVIDQLHLYPKTTFYYTNVSRTNENQARAVLKGNMDGESDGLNALINLFIMRDAQYFVGGFRSNWGRLVYEHTVGIGNKPAIVAVLDIDKKIGMEYDDRLPLNLRDTPALIHEASIRGILPSLFNLHSEAI